VSLSRLIGANKRYIEETIPHIAALMRERCEEVVEGAKVLVVGLVDAEILECLQRRTGKSHLVLDLVGIPGAERLEARYQGACW
jgi:GDP-mannose 6-dehydrogenase